MAQTMRHGGGGHGAMPVIAFLVAALLVAVLAIGYIAWQGQPQLAAQSIDVKLPDGPRIPSVPMPNPQPIPSPIPKPG